MKQSFLDYYKQVLEKVSFDPQLVKKEYHKALAHLQFREIHHMNEWMASRGMLEFVR